MKYVLIAASTALALGLAAPAFAADPALDSNTGLYGGIGWVGVNDSDHTVNGVQGRVGYRFMNYLGVEGEAAFGVGDTDIGSGVKAHLNNEAGVYGVGFLPVSPNFDVFARVGWAEDDVSVKNGSSSLSGTDNGFAWGLGGQYYFDGKNGIRADWTRQQLNHDIHPDVWSVSYTRRF